MKVLSTLVIAAVAAVVALGPAPAGAEPPVPTQSADGSVCGEVTLSGTPGQYPADPPAPTGYTLSWRVEGDTENNGAFDLPGSDTVTFDEDYLGGEISVVYSVTGPESDENLDPEEVTVDTDCAEPTEPTEPPTTEPAIEPVSPAPAEPAAPVAPAASPVVAQPQFTG